MHQRGNGKEAANASFLLTRAVAQTVRLCGALSALLILLTLAIVTYAVIQRYVLDSPLLWGDELLGYVLVATIMLGAAEALRRDAHISIDFITARARPPTARLLRIWSDLAVMAFAAVFGWSTWQSITFNYDFGSYSPGHLEVAMWIPQLPMLLGAILLGLTALARILEAAARGSAP